MKRNQFLSAALSLGALPFITLSTSGCQTQRTETGFKVKNGEARLYGHITLKGVNHNVMDLKVSGKDTNGGMTIFQQISISKGMGTPLHVHHYQDEVFYVIEGSYRFQVGKEYFSLVKGEHIFLPKAVPHAWTQVSDTGKMNVLFQPAGKMEEFFLTMAGLDHEPDKAEIENIFADCEMSVVGPPLTIN
ncbi:MAG: cupin domain-containing protein [Muriicola sp.]|nr:cupin domain-containing protein [Muriicola sp.]NNK10088.1 cupin domain-containing protein [Flavobacteriaceae bacterium]